MEYYMKKKLNANFEEALQKVEAALTEHSFGVISTIDFKEKFKEKLDKDFKNYIVFGACQPKVAWEAIHEEIDLGVLLPCNVAIYEEKGEVFVSAVNPMVQIEVTKNNNLMVHAKHVTQELQKILDSLN